MTKQSRQRISRQIPFSRPKCMNVRNICTNITCVTTKTTLCDTPIFMPKIPFDSSPQNILLYCPVSNVCIIVCLFLYWGFSRLPLVHHCTIRQPSDMLTIQYKKYICFLISSMFIRQCLRVSYRVNSLDQYLLYMYIGEQPSAWAMNDWTNEMHPRYDADIFISI